MLIFESSPTVIKCVFTVNTASMGGGLYINGANPTFTSCTFSLNTATNGGAMYNTVLRVILAFLKQVAG